MFIRSLAVLALATLSAVTTAQATAVPVATTASMQATPEKIGPPGGLSLCVANRCRR